MVIRTMGRWSSDCYRLYVRTCYQSSLSWTAAAGSAAVDDIEGPFAHEYSDSATSSNRGAVASTIYTRRARGS
eukprot:2220226-Prymnesium_polylepis.1